MVARSLSKQLLLPRLKKSSCLDFFPLIEGEVNRQDNGWEVPSGGKLPRTVSGEGRSRAVKSGLEGYRDGGGRPLIFKRLNLISRASSSWRQFPDLSEVFSWGLGTHQGASVLGPNWGTNLAKQLVKLIWPPENWTAINAVKWTVPVVLKIEHKANGFPTVPPQSFLSEWSHLQEHVLILWFLMGQMSDSDFEKLGTDSGSFNRRRSFFLFGECLWAACARLCAQHGHHSPFPPGGSSGAESLTGLTDLRASALTSFLSPCYYWISSVLCCMLFPGCYSAPWSLNTAWEAQWLQPSKGH